MKIAIGADEAGFSLKEEIEGFLESNGHKVVDHGVYDLTPVLYPDIASKVALSVARGNEERGILICGTGIGMAITANKIAGIWLNVTFKYGRSTPKVARINEMDQQYHKPL